MTTKEDRWKKMMGEEINCWMWNFHSALPYVADLVTSESVTINHHTDVDKVAKGFVTEEHDLEAVSCLLKMFQVSLSTELDLDFLGIHEDALSMHNLTEDDLVEIFECNAITVARLYKEAQTEFQPTYTTKEIN